MPVLDSERQILYDRNVIMYGRIGKRINLNFPTRKSTKFGPPCTRWNVKLWNLDKFNFLKILALQTENQQFSFVPSRARFQWTLPSGFLGFFEDPPGSLRFLGLVIVDYFVFIVLEFLLIFVCLFVWFIEFCFSAFRFLASSSAFAISVYFRLG